MLLSDLLRTNCEDSHCASDSQGTEVLVEGSLRDLADTELADRKQGSRDTRECNEHHGIADEDAECAWEVDGLEIPLEEIIPVPGEQKPEWVRGYLWPLSKMRVLWSIILFSRLFSKAIFMKFLSTGLSPWL